MSEVAAMLEIAHRSKWEDVDSPCSGDYLERIKVPGGWIYRNYFTNPGSISSVEETRALAMVFVPEKF